MTSKTTTAAGKRVLPMAGHVLSAVALGMAVLAALVLIVVPKVTGSTTFAVLTSSMAPHYGPGTLLVVKPAPFESLAVGDVITYQIESGRPDVITHRIISVGATQEGERTFITKGDNNSVADKKPVREVQVRGRLFYAVPYAGFLANALGHSDRGLAVQIAAAGLIGYGVLTVSRGILTARKDRSARRGRAEVHS